MAAIRRAGPSLCPRSGGVHLRFVSLKPLGTSRARGVRSAAGTGTSALQRMGWGAKWPGTLARSQHAPRGMRNGKNENLHADQRATTRRRCQSNLL